jgi:VanZ family protein
MRLFLKSLQPAAWLLLLAIVVLSVCPPQMRPQTAVPHDTEHFAVFAACGFCFGAAYRHKLFSVLWVLVFFSAGIELLQTVIPGRHARLTDFIVDLLSICVGTAIGAVLRIRLADPKLP